MLLDFVVVWIVDIDEGDWFWLIDFIWGDVFGQIMLCEGQCILIEICCLFGILCWWFVIGGYCFFGVIFVDIEEMCVEIVSVDCDDWWMCEVLENLWCCGLVLIDCVVFVVEVVVIYKCWVGVDFSVDGRVGLVKVCW